MSQLTEIYGTLAPMTVELPYEDEERAKEAEKINEEIKGLGFRTFRAATDWGYLPFEDDEDTTGGRREPARFKSGDLVKIFKTVSDGDIEWEGVIDFDRSDYHHGLQKGLAPRAWGKLFSAQLPARLEKNGKTIYGALEPFCETGTEGVIWAVSEYGKAGYAGLTILEDGDKLTVFNNVRDGEIEWEGELDFGPEQVSKIGWTEIMRETNHMDTPEWLQLSWERRPAVITPS